MSVEEYINEMYIMLDFRNSYSTRIAGIEMAKKVTDLSLLIMPPAGVSVWEECANILFSKTDEELSLYLPQLLEWLQDIDWPGARCIYNRLLKFDGDCLDDALDGAIEKAKIEKDDRWLDIVVLLKSDRKNGVNSFPLY